MALGESCDESLLQTRLAELKDRLSRDKLDDDARNVFCRLDRAIIDHKKGRAFTVKPLPGYEENLRQRPATPPEEFELTMKLSDPEKVAAFDRTVAEFNADVLRINQEQDIDAVKHFQKLGLSFFPERSL